MRGIGTSLARRTDAVPRSYRAHFLGLRRSYARDDPRDYRQRDGLSSPSPSTPISIVASRRQPFFSVLALDHYRHVHARVGSGAPQTPRDLRNGTGPAQSAGTWHLARAV